MSEWDAADSTPVRLSPEEKLKGFFILLYPQKQLFPYFW